MYRFPKTLVLLPFLLLFGVLLIYSIDKYIEGKELEKRKKTLQEESKIAAAHFQKGMEKFSILVSGVRSHIEANQSIPDKTELQKYLKSYLRSLPSQPPLIISYIDTNHIFQYSITQESVTPNTLKGSSVAAIRDAEEVARLNALLASDELRLFPPLNLVEGWVGIPLCFRVKEKEKVVGYFAPIINIETILNEIYNKVSSKDYVYQFSTNGGATFDRFGVYDGSPFYNINPDPDSYKYYAQLKDHFTFSSVPLHGYQFDIGVAYKKPYQRDTYLSITLISWMGILFFSVLVFLIYWDSQVKRNELLEQKNLELTNANDALNKFAYAASHDLKEPLRSISSFSTLLQKRYEGQLDDNANQYINYIVSGVQKMNQLLIDLLDYSKLVHKKDLPKEEVDLNRVVQDVENALDFSIRENNVKLLVDDLPISYSNPGQMYQLFQNFISNAVKFNDNSSPTVHIGSKKMENKVIYFVKDNGMGIRKDYHEKVFEVFQRLSTKKNGTGVGLAICKKIVEQHEGEIWVDSAEGEGCTFYFTLHPN